MIDKLDKKVFVTPAARAAQNGNASNRIMMIVNKVDEVIDALGTVATAATVAAINTQLTAIVSAQNTFFNQLNTLTGRVTALEIAPADAITNVNEALSLSLGGVLNMQALTGGMTSQAQTINKILAVMRTRKEIKP
ncbi:hypothetical protein [Hymenobacter fodinae]|uniref:Uncharacterized protein n=1 Tax=Hymenobacter fodinae TaxID=2510796 RepID=A0A4Z0P1F8_9BACT|nr:hypothetical protein [Hymenobacter fodinae]TGE04622.1 hypothetical protein EU556_20775 [Hymenobacter fodinae]